MDSQALVTSDPEILVGKPIVRGTRLSVEFLLGLLAKGWSQQRILDAYAHLTAAGLQAAIAFAAEAVQHEVVHPIRPDAD